VALRGVALVDVSAPWPLGLPALAVRVAGDPPEST
jgi:hypothetical protein